LWLQAANSLFVIALAPVFAAIWLTLGRRGRDLSSPSKFTSGLFFAGIGFVLAIAGAYGAVAWAVRRRTAEFGVRMALGATGSDIRRHMLAYGSRLAAIGLAIGLVCALALGRLLNTFLFEVQPGDPLTLLAITATVFLAVLAAAWLPARRASRIDPTVALGR